MSELSASDVMAMTNNNRDNFLEGNGIVILILFILMFSGGFGGGWGNNSATQGALTRAEMYDGFNAEEIKNQVMNNARMIDNHNVALLENVNQLQQNMLTGFCGVQNAICQSTNNLNMNIAQQGFNNQQAFCDIKTTIHDEAEETRALIVQNEIQNLRDTVANKDRELLTQSLLTSQIAQTNSIQAYLRALIRNTDTTPTGTTQG